MSEMPNPFGEGTTNGIEQTGGHIMPPWVKAQLMTRGSMKQHLPAAYKVAWFRSVEPGAGIETTIIAGGDGGDFACVQATIRGEDGRVLAQGTKTETKQDFPAGWVEKAETGAIARALAFLGFGTQYTLGISASEDAEGPNRNTDGGVWYGPGPCSGCNAPEGKPHARRCSRVAAEVMTPASERRDREPAQPATAPAPTAQAPAAQQAAQGQETALTAEDVEQARAEAKALAAKEAKQARIALFARLTGLGYDTDDKGGRDRLGAYALGAEAPASWGKLTKAQALKIIDVLDVAPPSEIKRVWVGTPEPAAEPALFTDGVELTDPFGDE